MKKSSGKLLEAFVALRESKFEKAFELADGELRKNINNFQAWYLAAVSLGFLDKRTTFQHYLERAALLEPDSIYISYLRAYTKLWNEDIEGALLEWTRLIDLDEGWLARDLIENARKGANLIEKSKKGDISYFIVMPDFRENNADQNLENLAENSRAFIKENRFLEQNQQNKKVTLNSEPVKSAGKKSFLFPMIKYGIILSGFLLLLFLIKSPVLHYMETFNQAKDKMWKNFKIDEWAALVNVQNKENTKFEYKKKDQLIEDFEEAKEKLSENKINQARFLLQRIIKSNADFKTKEKSKIFLNFIPEPNYQDFSDPVFPDKLLKEPDFYQECLVLWQGSVIKMRDVDHGKEVRLLIKDASSDYMVDAFLQSKESKPDWLPFSDFQASKELSKKKPQAIIYGKFKGLVGNQKTIYLELIQLWM